MALPGGSPHARARAMQAVSLVERPRACIVHPSAQCAAAAEESLQHLRGRRGPAAGRVLRLLLAVEGVGADPRAEAAALLDEADREFADLDDDWGRAVVAFVRMEIQLKRGDRGRRAGRRRRRPSAGSAHWTTGGDCPRCCTTTAGASSGSAPTPTPSRCSRRRSTSPPRPGCTTPCNGPPPTSASPCWRWAGWTRRPPASPAPAPSRNRSATTPAGSWATYGEALLAARHGDYARARPLFETARAAFERLGVWLATGLALAGVADCDARLGRPRPARATVRATAPLAETTGEVGLLCLALEGSARTVVEEDPGRAAAMLGRAAHLRARYDRPQTEAERAVTAAAALAARQALGDVAYEAAARAGAELGLGSVSG